jgi:hypothetical protein
MSDEKFGIDLDVLVAKLAPDRNDPVFSKLEAVKAKLVEMHTQNLVKINHSVMEVICARELILKGYEVDVEHSMNGSLVCDLFGVKGDGRTVVEIETGFISPEHALDPASYYSARVASKIARYSVFADKFSLASPLNQVLPIPILFSKPPRLRELAEIEEAKRLCDRYYKSPPITLEEIAVAKLHSVFLIDVDSSDVREFDPEIYGESVLVYLDAMRK